MEELSYKNHKFAFESNDTFYLFSDGFCDQFGGPNDKKFMSKKFRELLQQIQPMSMKEQEKILRNSIEEWMGSQEQSDDILVIGIRF
ncbi:MAG: SpoIIE family protein phosphatase [Bacteroidetes bacterium]|nr:SpoIIE family protein phosphatase [Bacteroidota bacterium]MBK9672982.1 SpoIIE family protein phosphatase [Bacteroidota bacterium]MBK9799165.1 SpoIIE family protein phosphatase [Bacteroidota bacterium]